MCGSKVEAINLGVLPVVKNLTKKVFEFWQHSLKMTLVMLAGKLDSRMKEASR